MKNKKIIWLVNPYGPIEGESWRDYRFNQFGKFLSNKGYSVIWWTSNFAHHFKHYRSNGLKDIHVTKSFITRLVPVPSYKSNNRFGRYFKDIIFSIKAFHLFNKETKPHLIISADNPLTFSLPSFKFAKNNNIPIIYDQMDLWPEFIESSLPSIFHIFFLPFYHSRKINYSQLSGGISLGKNYLARMRNIQPILLNKPTELIYNGIDVMHFRNLMKNKLNNKLIPFKKKQNELWFIFAGTLGPSYDLINLLEAVKKLNNHNYKFLIAGSGPLMSIVVEFSKKYSNIIYLGKVSPNELYPIYNICDVGLALYTKKSNVDMPDKFYDYTSAGLAIINSLNGEVSDYISKYNLGFNYHAGNLQSLIDAINNLSNSNLMMFKKNSFDIAPLFDTNLQMEKLNKLVKRVIK
jgi:glycosyltransferase involved in cell wall biosynthesis